MTMLTVTRTVTPDECHWLSEPVVMGTQVFRFYGLTYGCIGPDGIAVSDYGDYPFYELPRDAVRVT